MLKDKMEERCVISVDDFIRQSVSRTEVLTALSITVTTEVIA